MRVGLLQLKRLGQFSRAAGVFLGGLLACSVASAQFQFDSWTTENGLPQNSVNDILQTRDSYLWLATYDGLVRFDGIRFTVFNKGNTKGISSNRFDLLFEDRHGILWAMTDDSLVKYQAGVFTTYTIKDGGVSDFITTLYEDRDGYLWIGTTYGLHRFKDGKISAYPNPEGFFREGTWVIHQDKAGRFWFGTSNGLVKYEAGQYIRYTAKDGLAGNDVKAILEDRAGQLWFGTWGGLSRYENGRFTSYTEQDGLAGDHIRTLYEDIEGILWIGTYDGGLSRFRDGRFTRYTTNDGLFNNGVFQILEDERGNFWMSSNRGIYRVARQELNDFADGKIRAITSVAYGKNDGLLNIECNGGRQPAGWKTGDGRLWFPTIQGAAVIDPSRIEINQQPPPVIIEEFRSGDEVIDFPSVAQIPPEKDGFEIRYTAPSFIKPEHIKFKYKLEGFDKNWIDADTRRTANYSYIPPGEYTFTVIAANSDGVWNQTGKSLRITVVPYWWERKLVQALLVLVAVFLLISTILSWNKRRISRLEKEKAAREDFARQLIASQENERKRVAGELHDGLGTDLSVIKMRARERLFPSDS